MAIIPEPEISTISLIDKHHEQKLEKPRLHMGFSLLGHHCDRWLWLSFRWAVREQFPGRIKRLFRRGHAEELTAASDLREIGVDLRDTGRTQRTIYAGSHVQGSPDGIIYSGLPEARKTVHVWECKTHSKKSFDELVKHGVQKAKPMHYIQMQCSMTAGNINRALYYAVCKDDDRIYTERIHVETVLGHKHLERGKALALSERIPEPISADPSWYQCKLCAAHGFCHEGDHTKEISCRSCAHSTPTQKGTWTCSRWNNAEIPPDAQYEGCRAHVFHPDLVKWKILEDRCSQWTACWEIDGTQIRNGEDGYSSREILTGGPFHDPVVDMARDVFGGEIVDYAAPIPS